MADVKVENEANVVASIAGTEVSYLVQDPTGTPTPGQVTKAVEKAYYNSAPALTGIGTYDSLHINRVDAGNQTGSYTLAKTADYVKITATGNVTLAAPSAGTSGKTQAIEVEIVASGADRTITPSGFVDNTAVIVLSGQTKYYNVLWNGTEWLFFGDIKAADIASALAAPGAIGGTTPAAITGTTIQANTGFVPDANDGAYLGTASLGFSDLFLASGGILNWANGDVTLTHSTGALALSVATFTLNGSQALIAGKTTIPLAASALVPATTNGPAKAQIETTTNKVNLEVLDFDGTTAEAAYFTIPMPKSYNNGTVTFEVIWTTTNTGTAGVAWTLAGGALSDNDTIDTALGTAVAVTDAGQSSNAKAYKTSESSAVTIAGSPTAGDLVIFKLARDPSNGSDTMTEDARLIGLRLFFTTNAANDA